MLSERLLLWLGVGCAVLGILALYVVLLFAELPVNDLSVVSGAHQDETVRVVATVSAVRPAGNGTVTILSLSEPVTRTAVVFDAVNLTPGEKVDVEGQVQLYEGSPELVVSRLTTVK